MNAPTRRDESVHQVCSFYVSTPDLNCVANLGGKPTFFTKNFCFQLLHQVSNESIVSREGGSSVNVHVLQEVSDLAGFESKGFRCLGHSGFPESW